MSIFKLETVIMSTYMQYIQFNEAYLENRKGTYMFKCVWRLLYAVGRFDAALCRIVCVSVSAAKKISALHFLLKHKADDLLNRFFDLQNKCVNSGW